MSADEFGSELRRIAPQLRLHGISVSFERRGGDRVVTLKIRLPHGHAVNQSAEGLRKSRL
jgi:hypothetical protein